MTQSLELLSLPQTAATKAIVQEALKPGIDINNLVIGQYSVASNGDINLPIFVDSHAYDDPNWRYVGDVNLRYKRLDLETTFGRLNLRFRCPNGVYQTADILAEMSDIFSMSLSPLDFVLDTQVFTTISTFVTLTAAVDSSRWKGSVKILVYR